MSNLLKSESRTSSESEDDVMCLLEMFDMMPLIRGWLTSEKGHIVCQMKMDGIRKSIICC